MTLYPWIVALHVTADVCFVSGVLATWFIQGFRATVREPGFEAAARDLEEWIAFGVTNVALAAVLATGVTLLSLNPALLHAPWLWLKLLFVAALFGLHGLATRGREVPAANARQMAVFTVAALFGVLVAVLVRPFG